MKLEIQPKNKLMNGELKLGEYILFEDKYFRVTSIGYAGREERISTITIDLSQGRLSKKIFIKKLRYDKGDFVR